MLKRSQVFVKIYETNINLTIDIGCNFNDKKISFFIRKFLGMQIGDPSVPQTKRDVLLQLNQYFKIFMKFQMKNITPNVRND